MDPELTSAAKSGDAATDERVGLFTPDKDRCTADGMGRAAVIAARRGTVCGEVGRVLRFCQLWSLVNSPSIPSTGDFVWLADTLVLSAV